MKRIAGLFPRWQPEYAAHGIATFPVRITEDIKKPAIKGYQKVGLKGSAELATKFSTADAFGYIAGKRTKTTVLDVDTRDEKILSDALDRHGHTPIVIRTGSGKFHALYRYNGERRLIRPWRGLPIDLLGGGFIIAPPSRATRGSYEFIHGSLDDLDQLPVLRDLDLDPPKTRGSAAAKDGERGSRLFEHLMRAANCVSSFDELLDEAKRFGVNCEPPMEDDRMLSTAESVWKYTEQGLNRFGQHGAWMAATELDAMIVDDQDALILLAFLRRHQGPAATFMCANGLAETFGWHRVRLANARRRLIELGYFKPIRQAGRGVPALFRWK
jgi:hypothetical protein